MNGVATASGAQPKNKVKNSRTQAWCMPAARMVKTVWVASKSPTPSQMAANHIQREDETPSLLVLRSMLKIVFQSVSENPTMQRIN